MSALLTNPSALNQTESLSPGTGRYVVIHCWAGPASVGTADNAATSASWRPSLSTRRWHRSCQARRTRSAVTAVWTSGKTAVTWTANAWLDRLLAKLVR